MLGCLPDAPPLAWQRISDKRVALVFENSGPFAVACRVLRAMPDQPYGTVVCGEGARFQQSLVHLGSLPRAPERIEYVGDFDWAGVRIASEAARAASKAGLPEIVPAVRLHRAMLESADSFGFPTGWPGIGATSVASTNRVPQAAASPGRIMQGHCARCVPGGDERRPYSGPCRSAVSAQRGPPPALTAYRRGKRRQETKAELSRRP
jgi:hypothetical protein